MLKRLWNVSEVLALSRVFKCKAMARRAPNCLFARAMFRGARTLKYCIINNLLVYNRCDSRYPGRFVWRYVNSPVIALSLGSYHRGIILDLVCNVHRGRGWITKIEFTASGVRSRSGVTARRCTPIVCGLLPVFARLSNWTDDWPRTRRALHERALAHKEPVIKWPLSGRLEAAPPFPRSFLPSHPSSLLPSLCGIYVLQSWRAGLVSV